MEKEKMTMSEGAERLAASIEKDFPGLHDAVRIAHTLSATEPLTEEQKALLANLRANLDKVMDAASVISYEAM